MGWYEQASPQVLQQSAWRKARNKVSKIVHWRWRECDMRDNIPVPLSGPQTGLLNDAVAARRTSGRTRLLRSRFGHPRGRLYRHRGHRGAPMCNILATSYDYKYGAICDFEGVGTQPLRTA